MRKSSMVAAFMLNTGVLAGAEKEIKLGLDEWPPFASQNISGRGLSAEIITEAFQHEGYKVKLSILPWSRVEQDIKQGKLDVMGNLYEIDEIKKYAYYSKPYYVSEVKFLAGNGFTGSINTLEDAKPYRIALGNGYSFGEVFDKAPYLQKTNCPTTINCILMLIAGRVELVIDSEEVLQHFLHTSSKIRPGQLKILPFTVIRNNMAIGISKKHPHAQRLIDDFNKGLDYLRSSKRLDTIIRKYGIASRT